MGMKYFLKNAVGACIIAATVVFCVAGLATGKDNTLLQVPEEAPAQIPSPDLEVPASKDPAKMADEGTVSKIERAAQHDSDTSADPGTALN